MIQIIYNVLPVSQPKIQRVDTALAFFQLSRMLSAGVNLSDALSDLATIKGSVRHQRMWKEVAIRVSAGKALSEALEIVPGTTDTTIIALLKAGEASGQLHTACDAIYAHLRWWHDLHQRMYTLLIYPLFSLFVLAGVTGFLFISVVPSIKGFLMSSGDELAWHTYALIGLSTWMKDHYLPALSVCVVVLLLLVFSLGVSYRARFSYHRALLRLPVIGRLITDLALSHYARCCAQLYDNGVALESSMELAESTVSNHVIRTELINVRTAMVGGATLADSMSCAPLLPSLFVRLVRVGEIAGRLAEVLTQLGDHQSMAVDVSIKRIEQLIGPLTLSLVGAMLLWIVVSVLAPVYDMAISTVIGAS